MLKRFRRSEAKFFSRSNFVFLLQDAEPDLLLRVSSAGSENTRTFPSLESLGDGVDAFVRTVCNMSVPRDVCFTSMDCSCRLDNGMIVEKGENAGMRCFSRLKVRLMPGSQRFGVFKVKQLFSTRKGVFLPNPSWKAKLRTAGAVKPNVFCFTFQELQKV